jgi:hypothetical protein
MNGQEPNPPRWADALLRSLLRPADRESIPGDLLEEYRAVKHPAHGSIRANAWYIKHVLSVVWQLIRPFALALAGASLLSLMVSGSPLLYGSLVEAPGVSLVHALVYAWAGFHASRRTRLISTGMLAAGGTSVVAFTVLFTAIAISTPGLLLAPFRDPFIPVILATLLLIALGYSVVVGAIGAIAGRWAAPEAPRDVRVS